MKAGFLTLILALAISTLSLPDALAQAEQDTPESVAKVYVDATLAGDWAKAASFTRPESLAQFKRLFEPVFANEKTTIVVGMLFGVKSRAEFDQLSDAQLFEKLLGSLMGGKDAPAFTKNVMITKLEVMTLKRYENTWRMTLSSELEGMTQMIANMFAAAAAEEDKRAPVKAPSRPAKARKPARKP
jgi:hypothetical protein